MFLRDFFFGCPGVALSAPYSDRLAKVRAIADRVAHGYNLTIFDVQLRRESVGLVLRVIIDRPAPAALEANETSGHKEAPVSIAECRQVSGDLSAILDVEEIVVRNYTLEVSSPGIDRPLRHLDDFRRFVGRVAKIVTTQAIDGQMYVSGRIKGVEGDVVVIKTDRSTHRISFSLITKAHLEVEF